MATTWITVIVSAITALLGALGGSSILFFKQDKQRKELDNEITQSAQWRELYLESKDDSKLKEEKINEFLKTIEDLRLENTNLKLANTELEWNRCVVNGCNNRRPPRNRDICGLWDKLDGKCNEFCSNKCD